MKHTPSPWEIEWYECRADRDDVKAGTAKKVGDVLWRVPKSIGPVSPDEDHWARFHLSVSEEDAYLVAAAPELLNAVRFLLDNPDNRISAADRKAAYCAIAKATGG